MKAWLSLGLFALPVLALMPIRGHAQFGLPVKVPKAPDAQQLQPQGLPIPRAEDLIHPSPPITTSLAQAHSDVLLFDDWQPQNMQSLVELPQDANGNFQLQPGLYQLNVESYSLQVGAYSPDQRHGYLSAPLVENNTGLIGRILQQVVQVPDLTQSQIQALIWAILVRADLTTAAQELQATAKQLLTDDEIKTLNQQALGLIPADQTDSILVNVPADALIAVEAEVNMRAALAQQKDYGDLEKIAVPSGSPTTNPTDRKVPKGRWSYHPNGFFIRYLPVGYRRTQIQIAVPEQYQVKRDALGRIIAIADPAGNRIEMDYDDTTAPLTISDAPTLVGYAFEEIRFIRQPSPAEPPETLTLANIGWTLVQKPTASSADLPLPTSLQPIAQTSTPNATELDDPDRDETDAKGATDRFKGWKKRYQQTENYQEAIAAYLQRWQTIDKRATVMQLADLYHLADAIAAATQDDEWDQYQWLKEHQTAILKALQSETAKLEARGQSPTLMFNPTQSVAISGQQGRQMLGVSNRPYQP